MGYGLTNLIEENGFNRLKHTKSGYMLYNKHDIYVGACLDAYGEFSQDEADLFEQICQNGDNVVEVGANIGAHTIALANAVGKTGKVIAFEPQRIVFQTLCANAALNFKLNIYAYQMAVGAHGGFIGVPLLDYEDRNNFGGISVDQNESAGNEQVLMVSLDDFLKLDSLKLLKIDVEGFEKEVLLGAQKTLQKLKPILYVENDREDKSKELIELLWSYDYELYWHVARLARADNFYKNRERIFEQELVSFNMIGIHKSQKIQMNNFEKIVDSSCQIEYSEPI